MQYLKHPSGPQSHQALSTGFHGATSTQQTFKKRTTSVSKPVDRQIMEDFKTILDTC
jgi:fluoride ion exporter CrcB/FEX